MEILDAFRFENKPILGFEDLKSTKHNQQTYSRDRWKEMAETIRQMRKEEPVILVWISRLKWRLCLVSIE